MKPLTHGCLRTVAVVSAPLCWFACGDPDPSGDLPPDAGASSDAQIDAMGQDASPPDGALLDGMTPLDCGIAGDGSCDAGTGCQDDCNGHGQCAGSTCTCDLGYAGPACSRCDAGFEPGVADATTCVASACIGVDCPTGEICDALTGDCCSDACTEGVFECDAGMLRSCDRDPGACSEWSSSGCADTLCGCPGTGSDAVVVQWGQGSGDEVFDVAARPGGGAYVVGVVSNLPGQVDDDNDIFVGEVQGTAGTATPPLAVFGTDERDRGRAVAVAADGTLVVGAEVEAAFDSQTHFGARDALVAALTPLGEVLWGTQLGTRHQDEVWGVAVSPTGEIYAVGMTRGSFADPMGPALGDSQAYVTKLSNTGAVLWTEQWGSPGTSTSALDVDVDGAGDVYVGGGSTGPYCRKLSPNGDEVWNADLGSGPGTYGVASAADGGCLAGGLASGEAFVARTDPSGAISWYEPIPDVGFVAITGLALAPTGSVFVAGNVNGELVTGGATGGLDGFIAEVDPWNGALVAARQYGTPESDTFQALAVTEEQALVAAGRTQGSFPGFVSSGGNDALVVTDSAP